MAILKKIFGRLLNFLLPEKIPEFAAEMYINLVQNAKTQFYQVVAKEIIERIDQRGDIRNILDIGTGPGFMLFEIARLRPDLTLVGVDLSKKLIEFADSEKVRRGYRDIFFLIGDADHLVEFSDNDCDFVISSGVLHSLKNPSMTIREWLRVLKPGHDLWIYDPTVLMTADDRESAKKLLDEMCKRLKSRKDRFLFRIMRLISNLPPRPMSLEKIYEIIREAGVDYLINVENRKHYLKIETIKTVPFRIIE